MNFHPGTLLIIGIAVFGGILSAWLIKKIKVPQVLGYILIGILLGKSGFQLVGDSSLETLAPFNFFALGIIGFLVGAELEFSTLKKYGRQLGAILAGEGLMAFLLVSIPVTLIMYRVLGNFAPALATGIVFGAIASATDPASTINVLWEYRSKGILTTTLIAIVALDDALAMSLYGLGTSTAQILTGGADQVLSSIINTAFELGGAVVTGIVSGAVVAFVLKKTSSHEAVFTFCAGMLLLLIGISSYFHTDVILATMAFGITTVNMEKERCKKLIEAVRNFAQPIYILFFVLVGCKLSIGNMPNWLWLIVGVYVVGRSLGKMFGARIGARITGAPMVVRKYSGLGLFAQGGVAVGLSIMASHHLGQIEISDGLYLADVVIFGVTATTFIVQLIGPPLALLAVKLANETGKNISREDVINQWNTEQILDTDIQPIQTNTPVEEVIRQFANSQAIIYPVVDKNGRAVGLLSLSHLKNVITDAGSWVWLVAADVMSSLSEKFDKNAPLSQTLNTMTQLGLDQAIALNPDQTLAGMIDRREINRKIQQHIIELCKQDDV